MIPQSNLVEPSPEFCVRDSKRHTIIFPWVARLWKAVKTGDAATVYPNAANDDWDGDSFWRSASIDGDTVTIEFNDNFRERFTNPDWRMYELSRADLLAKYGEGVQ